MQTTSAYFSAKVFDTPSVPWLNFRPPMKTFSAKAEQVERKWHILDADNQVVGRVAEKAAVLLRGKHKAIYTNHVDTGDHVIVINAEKAVFTGKKETQKEYMSYSGYIGGHKSETVKSRRARHPELIIEGAIKGMIPHNRLGRSILRKLHIYKGSGHPHAAQVPAPFKIK
jgi:large subunit ribosomal protein L13